MARTKSISTIEAEISKTEKDLARAQARYDSLAGHLLELQQKKKDYEAKQVMDAFNKSGKSLDELLTFLEV